jgi:hypothetical protein
MIRVDFDPPSVTGIDWKNPAQVRDYNLSQNEAVRKAFEKVGKEANEARLIKTPSGGSLGQKNSSVKQLWIGAVVMHDGTLAEARRLGYPLGFEICDGHDDLPDVRDRFIKGAGADEDSGETGGATSGTVTIPVAAHTAHSHLVCCMGGCACACDAVVTVATCGAGVSVSLATHGHNVYVSGSTADCAEDDHSACVATVTYTPPYYEMIFLKRVK